MKRESGSRSARLGVTVLFFTIAIGQVASESVYFVGKFGLNVIRNKVYSDLLTDGLTFTNELGEEVFVPGMGFEVVYTEDTDDSVSEALNHDLVFAPESCSSTEIAMYGNQPIPYLVTENALVRGRTSRDGALWFGTTDSAPAGDIEFEIVDNTHPITSVYDEGQFIQVTINYDTGELGGAPIDAVAPGVTPLALTGGVGPLRYCLMVMDEGETGLSGVDPIPDGFEPTPARRAYLGYHRGAVDYFGDDNTADPRDITITEDAAILFQRVVQWLVGLPVTADGTEAGVGVADWAIY